MTDKALENFKDALLLCEKFDPKHKHPTTTDALVGLGSTNHVQGKYNMANITQQVNVIKKL